MTADNVELIDLAREKRLDLLSRFYQEVYAPAFPIADEREELPSLVDSVTRGSEGSPQVHVIIAGEGLPGPQASIFGGQIVEYYRRSNVGLMTYLVVAPHHQRRGLGAELLTSGLRTLDADATAEGLPSIQAYLAEANNPADPMAFSDPQNPQERLRVLARLGFLALDLPYTQPRLHGKMNRYYGLLLLVHSTSPALFPPAQLPPTATAVIASSVLESFLPEFFEAVEGHVDRSDPDLGRMLRMLAERPTIGAKNLPT